MIVGVIPSLLQTSQSRFLFHHFLSALSYLVERFIDLQVVRELIETGGDVNGGHHFKYSALHCACRIGKVKAVSLIIDASAT